MSNISERLKEFLILNNLSALSLSKLVDIDRSTISALIRGENLPSLENLLKLVCFFNCSADYLLGLTDDYPEKTYRVKDEKFGKRFRDILKKASVSQYQLTKQYKISSSLIYRWLNDLTLPNSFYLIKLSQYLEVSVDNLLGIEN